MYVYIPTCIHAINGGAQQQQTRINIVLNSNVLFQVSSRAAAAASNKHVRAYTYHQLFHKKYTIIIINIIIILLWMWGMFSCKVQQIVYLHWFVFGNNKNCNSLALAQCAQRAQLVCARSHPRLAYGSKFVVFCCCCFLTFVLPPAAAAAPLWEFPSCCSRSAAQRRIENAQECEKRIINATNTQAIQLTMSNNKYVFSLFLSLALSLCSVIVAIAIGIERPVAPTHDA